MLNNHLCSPSFSFAAAALSQALVPPSRRTDQHSEGLSDVAQAGVAGPVPTPGPLSFVDISALLLAFSLGMFSDNCLALDMANVAEHLTENFVLGLAV